MTGSFTEGRLTSLESMNEPRFPKIFRRRKDVNASIPRFMAILTTMPLEPRWNTRIPNRTDQASPARIPQNTPVYGLPE